MLTLLQRRVYDSTSTEPGRPPEIEGAVRKAASRRPIQDNARTEYAGEKKPSEQSNGGRGRGLTKEPFRRKPGRPSEKLSYLNAKTRPLVRDKNSKKKRPHESCWGGFNEDL